MREINKIITYNDTVFVASDGREFEYKWECETYEAKISPLFKHMNNIPHKNSPQKWLTSAENAENFKYCNLYDDFVNRRFVSFFIRNSDDVKTMNKWIECFSIESPVFSDSDIGTIQIFRVNLTVDEDGNAGELDFSDMKYISSADNLKEQYNAYIDSFTRF